MSQLITDSDVVRTVPGLREFKLACPRPEDYAPSIQIDSANAYDGGNTGYETTIRPGTIMARVTSSKKSVPCKRSAANGAGLAATALIVDRAAPFKAGDDVAIVGKRDSLKIDDNDSAASAGVALYLHLDEKSQNSIGHLEFVSPTNAAGSFTTIAGSVVEVNDDDAAGSGGVALYFDEDGADGEKLLATTPNGKDAYILDTAGRAIKIKYHAAPGTPGVQLYFDEDGAAGDRVQFVSPTNADGRIETDTIVGVQSAITKATGINVDSINYETNTLTLASAQTWVDGDQVYCSSLAGSEIARGILDEEVDLYDNLTRDVIDRASGRLMVRGQVVKSQLLGDYDACTADGVTHYLSQIQTDVQLGAD